MKKIVLSLNLVFLISCYEWPAHALTCNEKFAVQTQNGIAKFEGLSQDLTPEIRVLYENIFFRIVNSIQLPNKNTFVVDLKNIAIKMARVDGQTGKLILPPFKETTPTEAMVYIVAHEAGHFYLDSNLAKDSKFYQKYLQLIQTQSKLTAEFKDAVAKGKASNKLLLNLTKASTDLLEYNEIISPLHEMMADMIAVSAYKDGAAMRKARESIAEVTDPLAMDLHDATTPYHRHQNDVVNYERHIYFAELKKVIWKNYLSEGQDPRPVINALYRSVVKFLDEGNVGKDQETADPSAINKRLLELFAREFVTR